MWITYYYVLGAETPQANETNGSEEKCDRSHTTRTTLFLETSKMFPFWIFVIAFPSFSTILLCLSFHSRQILETSTTTSFFLPYNTSKSAGHNRRNPFASNDVLDSLNIQTRRVVLHVGPHKTGTTFLQMLLLELSSRLATDGYGTPIDISGRFERYKATANVAISLNSSHPLWYQPSQDEIHEILASFETFLNHSYSSNQSIVLSSEAFAMESMNIEQLFQYFRGRWGSTRVVITYRRLYEWCLSWYFEVHRRRGEAWPSFLDWLAVSKEERSTMTGSVIRERYIAHLTGKTDDVHIVNYHSETLVEEQFFCDAIPLANSSCIWIKQQPKQEPANVGSSLEFRRVAVALRDAGKVGENVPIEALEASIRKKLENVDRYQHDFWHCLNEEETEALFQASLREEKLMVPDWFEGQGGEGALRKDFDQFVSSGHLCSINETKLMSRFKLRLVRKSSPMPSR